MRRNMYVEIDPDVADQLRTLTERHGKLNTEATLLRAMRLLELVEPYLHDGLLAIVDPRGPEDDPEGCVVDLLFEGVAKRYSGKRAA